MIYVQVINVNQQSISISVAARSQAHWSMCNAPQAMSSIANPGTTLFSYIESQAEALTESLLPIQMGNYTITGTLGCVLRQTLWEV